MGQKVNPTGFRIGVIKDWDSRWYADKKNFGDELVSDYNLRKYIFSVLEPAGVPKIEIERDPKRIRVNISCAKPGIVIGKGGAEIEKLKAKCKEILGGDKDVIISIIEIKQPDLNAQLVAESIAGQLERRVSFRRAVKQSISRTMRLGAKGIKIQVNGRLGGAEIARSETYHEGTIPLQTIRADIDYGFAEAKTTYGRLGVKVWIYRGEILHANKNASSRDRDDRRRNSFRRDRQDGDRRQRRDGDRRQGRGRNFSQRTGRPPRRNPDQPQAQKTESSEEA